MKDKFKYVHWLKIENDMIEQVWINLKNYKQKYDCNMEVFYRETNFINKIIKLECDQSYRDLDLDVNSISDCGLIHLKQKPKNIIKYNNRTIEDYFERNIKSKIKPPKEILKGIYEIISVRNTLESSGRMWSEYMNLNTNNGTIIYDKTLGNCTPSPEVITISEFQEMINKRGIENVNGAKEFQKFILDYPEIYMNAINSEEKNLEEEENEF